jgi:two-component system sensor histidine kinase/response regulator
LRILLAEDNPVNQLYASTLLQQSGHYVRVARTGREALTAFEAESFDLALMDIEMPEMDGFAATAAIRQLERATGKHLPIVALTAHAVKGFREQCLAAGMDSYLSKPIRAQELLDTINNLANVIAPALPTPKIRADVPIAAPRIRPPGVVPADDLRIPAVAAKTPFDRRATLARVEGSAEMFHKLIASYLQESPTLQADLRRAVERRQATGVKQTANVLSGMFSVFSAESAREVASRLPDETADWPRAAVLVGELEREMVSLNVALKREVETPTVR